MSPSFLSAQAGSARLQALVNFFFFFAAGAKGTEEEEEEEEESIRGRQGPHDIPAGKGSPE